MKAAADWLQHRRTSERERHAREEARRDQFFERRTGFQRQTLLDLQESMMDAVRHASAMHHQDLMAFRKSGQWQKQLYDDELAEKSRLANARTTMLAVRVRDTPSRDLVAICQKHST